MSDYNRKTSNPDMEITSDYLETLLSGEVEVRNPFSVIHLPSHCRRYLRLHYYTNRSGFKGAIKVLIREMVLSFERRHLGGTRGVISYYIDGAHRELSFNPLNTQFHSVYAPPYLNGYEPETGALIDRLLPSRGVFFDVGANWGHFSLFAASKKDFIGQIHAFEPFPSTFADLLKSIEQTKLEKVISAHNLALSDSNGQARMVIPDKTHSGLASISRASSGIPMRLATLDSLDLPEPNLIKIDVEGHEAAVIRGSYTTISSARPMILFESATPGSPEELFTPFVELIKMGYSFFIPAFIRRRIGVNYLVGYGNNTSIKGRVKIALVPLNIEARFLMSSHFNVLACHKSRILELKQTLDQII